MQGVRAALTAVVLVSLAVGGCSGEKKPGERSGRAKPTTPAARTPVDPAARRATPPRRSAPRAQIVTRELLDETWTITAPDARRLERLYNLLTAKHWRLSGFRHSRLPAEQRRVEGLVTFRYDRTRQWIAQQSKPLTPRTRAQPGPAYVRLGKPKKWPWSPGVYESLRSLLLFAGMSASVRLRVPSRATLSFQLGLVAGRMGKLPLVLRLTLETPGGKQSLLLHHVGRQQAGRWSPVRFDLSAHAGKVVTLRLAVDRRGAETKHLGAVAIGHPVLQGREVGSKPNLVVVVLDTARYDALSAYVGRLTQTPHVDGVAKRGALFRNAYTNAAWTRPALMSMMSSTWPRAAGSAPRGFRAPSIDRWYLQHSKQPTLFSHLASQGYLNRGLINNFFMLPHERVGLDHGMSSFAHILFGQGPKRRDNPAITAAAERFLAAHRRHRFFLYVLYESAHSPYIPPPSARRRMRKLLGLDPVASRRRTGPRRRLDMMERYRAEVMNLDDHVGRIVAALNKNGLADNTYLVITSDHGEVISQQHCFFIPRLKYRTCYSHSASLYDQVLRIPMVVSGPGIRAGRRIDQIYQHVDLVPTLLDLMGLQKLPGAVGESHAKRLRSAKALALKKRDVYAQGRWVVGLRSGRYKLILRAQPAQGLVVHGRKRRVPVELYDLAKDPGERRNVARHRRALVTRLRARLQPFLEADRLPERPGMPRYLLRALRSRHAYFRQQLRVPKPPRSPRRRSAQPR